MHNISNLFYFGIALYMFRTVSPSIIRSLRLYIQHQVYVIWFCIRRTVWQIPDAVRTVLDSWWWTKRLSETCRVLFQNKINLRYCASGWFYYRNSSCLSICLPVLPRGTTRLPLDGFLWNLIFRVFENLLNVTRITGTLREKLCKITIISR